MATVRKLPIPGTELLYGLRDSERYLYHYTSAATFLDKILPNNTLRLSPYTETNDPKESKEWRFNATILDPSKYDFDAWPTDELCAQMNLGLKRRTNVVCLSCDKELTGNHLADIFNRGWCKPRMWAQYGDGHKGVCLVFDRPKLEVAFQTAFPNPRPSAKGKVTYCNRPILPDMNDPTYFVIIDHLSRLGWDKYIQFHLSHAYRRLFFEKNADWSGEDEFRFVIWGGIGAPEYLNFGDALRGVMFGANANEEAIQRAYSAVHDKGVFTQQLKWQGCSPWYELGGSIGWEIRYQEEMRTKAAGIDTTNASS